MMESCTNKTEAKWKYDVGDLITAKPAVGNGFVIVGGRDKGIFALNIETGSKIWQLHDLGCSYNPQIADGTIYFGQNSINNSNPAIFSVDAVSGKLNWRISSGLALFPFPVCNGDAVFFVKEDSLLSINKINGVVNWGKKLNGVLKKPTIIKGRIFVPCIGDSALYIVSEDGDDVLSVAGIDPEKSLFMSSVAGFNDFGLLAKGNMLYAFDSNGLLKWKFKNDANITSEICVGKNGIFFKDIARSIIGLDFSGKMMWKNQLKLDYKNAPELVSTKLFVPDGNSIIILDALTGQKIDSIALPDQASSSPTISGNVLFIGVRSWLFSFEIK